MQPRKCIKQKSIKPSAQKWFGLLTRGGRLREALIIGIWLEYFNSVLHRWSIAYKRWSIRTWRFVCI